MSLRLTFGILLLAALLSPSLSWAQHGPVIVIDPGHGGWQEGALGPGGVMEKHVCLKIAQLLRAKLVQDLGASVTLTREKDVVMPLSDRVDVANQKRPDLFLSLHANSMPTRRQRGSIEGIETYFLSPNASGDDARKTADRENAETAHTALPKEGDILSYILADLRRAEAHTDSSRLAYSVHQKLVAASGAVDRGVQQAPFFVLMGVDAPAVLVEVGFISHPGEGGRLNDPAYQARLAEAIGAGVQDFLTQFHPDGKQPVTAPSAAASP